MLVAPEMLMGEMGDVVVCGQGTLPLPTDGAPPRGAEEAYAADGSAPPTPPSGLPAFRHNPYHANSSCAYIGASRPPPPPLSAAAHGAIMPPDSPASAAAHPATPTFAAPPPPQPLQPPPAIAAPPRVVAPAPPPATRREVQRVQVSYNGPPTAPRDVTYRPLPPARPAPPASAVAPPQQAVAVRAVHAQPVTLSVPQPAPEAVYCVAGQQPGQRVMRCVSRPLVVTEYVLGGPSAQPQMQPAPAQPQMPQQAQFLNGLCVAADGSGEYGSEYGSEYAFAPAAAEPPQPPQPLPSPGWYHDAPHDAEPLPEQLSVLPGPRRRATPPEPPKEGRQRFHGSSAQLRAQQRQQRAATVPDRDDPEAGGLTDSGEQADQPPRPRPSPPPTPPPGAVRAGGSGRPGSGGGSGRVSSSSGSNTHGGPPPASSSSSSLGVVAAGDAAPHAAGGGFSAARAAQTHFEITIQFKHGRMDDYMFPQRIEPGTHVIVEGDRGQDLGMVVECVEVEYRREDLRKHHKVKRFATEEEVRRWRCSLVEEEGRALRYLRQQVARHNIPITVHCAEYQFDRKKLTFHYSTDIGHPDFRTLLRDGYKQFRCRIWMNNCQPKGTDPGQPLPVQPLPQYIDADGANSSAAETPDTPPAEAVVHC